MNNHPYCHVACGWLFIIRPIIGVFFTGLREFQPTMLLLVRTYEPVLLPVYNPPFGLSRLHLVLRE